MLNEQAGKPVFAATDAAVGTRNTDLVPLVFNEPIPVEGQLINRERASFVMKQLGLDGVVFSLPANVYYLTRHSDPLVSREPVVNCNAFAIMTQDVTRPISLVIGSWYFYYLYSDVHQAQDVAIYEVTDASQITRIRSEVGSVITIPDRGFVPLSEIEAHRAAATIAQAEARPPSSSMTEGLARALKDLGVIKGRIGWDVPFAHQALSEVAPEAELTDASVAVSMMRMVKSPLEIQLMKRTARITAEASLAAVPTVRAGGTYNDLRRQFFVECARRGNIGTWLLVDRVKPLSFDATFRDGQAFAIDAVAEGAGYFGDYGRTIFVGEPSRYMERTAKAIATGWDAIREVLRPGMRYSEISAIGKEAMRKGGFDTNCGFSTHSVGLGHTDTWGINEDIVLVPGMTISVDCAAVEVGLGGSAHLEDLTLITENGCEIINDTSDQTIMV